MFDKTDTPLRLRNCYLMWSVIDNRGGSAFKIYSKSFEIGQIFFYYVNDSLPAW